MDFGLESGNQAAAERLVFDFEAASLDEADTALCQFAEKLTATPGAVEDADIRALHAVGFSDEQISIAAQVIGYFNYINRIADGLGVDPEPEMVQQISEADWRAQKRQPAAG